MCTIYEGLVMTRHLRVLGMYSCGVIFFWASVMPTIQFMFLFPDCIATSEVTLKTWYSGTSRYKTKVRSSPLCIFSLGRDMYVL